VKAVVIGAYIKRGKRTKKNRERERERGREK
jgi:hypothetical protein